MSKKKDIAHEAEKHFKKATRLFKLSNEMHQAEKQGLIDEEEAIDIVVNLNEKGIEEAEQGIVMHKKLIDEQESDITDHKN